MNSRYKKLIKGLRDAPRRAMRTVRKYGRLATIGLLIILGVPVGILASIFIGGMGLALMGTAIGIGMPGWIALALIVALAVYGAKALVSKR